MSSREEHALKSTSTPVPHLLPNTKTSEFGAPSKLFNLEQSVTLRDFNKFNFSSPDKLSIELHSLKSRSFNLVKDLMLLISSNPLEVRFKSVMLGASSRPFKLFNLSHCIWTLSRLFKSLRPLKLLITSESICSSSRLGRDSIPERESKLSLELISIFFSDFMPLRAVISDMFSHPILIDSS